MAEDRILIIAENEIAIPKITSSNCKIDIIIKDFDDEILIKNMNDLYAEYYDYIVFTKSCQYVNEFLHYLPVTYIKENNNQLYISELCINNILTDNIELVVDRQDVKYVAVLIKYLIKHKVDEKNFCFATILKEIRRVNNFSKKDIRHYKKEMNRIIKKHYAQNNLIRIVIYNLKRRDILKKFAYNNLQNVLRDLKREIVEIEKIFDEIKICLKSNSSIVQK